MQKEKKEGYLNILVSWCGEKNLRKGNKMIVGHMYAWIANYISITEIQHGSKGGDFGMF